MDVREFKIDWIRVMYCYVHQMTITVNTASGNQWPFSDVTV